MRILLRIVLIVAALLILLTGLLYLRQGGGSELPNRSTPAALSFDIVETVVDLDYPPGNIAVAADGRVFFTLHPDGNPPQKVMLLGPNGPQPWPNATWQHPSATVPSFQSILSLRIDQQNRLWILDFAEFGRGQPRLLAFDIDSAELVERYDFSPEVAGLGSMLNDLQVSPDGLTVYIAETSPLLQTPALIVYNTVERTARRLLEGHVSVASEELVIRTPLRAMRILGLIDLRIGVDSIALDRSGEWLYFGAVTAGTMWRIRTSDLRDEHLSESELAGRVEAFAEKTLSDGLTSDSDGNIYLSDMEHRAVHQLTPNGEIRTLLQDSRLRWPDGFSFGPDGWLYVTCSALDSVLFVSQATMEAARPFQIYRFRPGPIGVAGH
ncbi:MAG: sugar lactone lactonase YvrE [Hyphomicrobiaceae bacterium]|jgi:sugar lactone lactonase YvrE